MSGGEMKQGTRKKMSFFFFEVRPVWGAKMRLRKIWLVADFYKAVPERGGGSAATGVRAEASFLTTLFYSVYCMDRTTHHRCASAVP